VAKPQIPISDLYIGTENPGATEDAGITDNSSLVSAVWSGFQQLNITNAAGDPLRFVPNTNNAGGIAATATQLLGGGTNYLGRGVAWAGLFVDVLRAWGDTDVGATSVNIIQPTQGGITINNAQLPMFMTMGSWSFGACVPPNLPEDAAFRPATSQGFVWYNVINSATWPAWFQSQNFAWANNPPAVESPRGPLAAQNMPAAWPFMISDAVVNIGGTLYDPGYGLSFSSLQAYSDQIVSGLAFEARARQSDFGFNPSGGAYDPDAFVLLMLFKQGAQLTMWAPRQG
jgi:hypothetical protein